MAACLLCRHFHGVSADEPPHDLLIVQHRGSARDGSEVRWVCSQCGRIWKPIDGVWVRIGAY